jgi:protein MAK11
LSSTSFLLVTGSSDGTVRFWALDVAELKAEDAGMAQGFTALQVGRLLGLYTTGTRITCLKAFPMTGTPDDEEEEEEVLKKDADESSEDEEDSE